MSPAVDVKTLIIDGVDLSARADQTVLEVARENNIFIPTLCHLDGLSDSGACRLCLVELKNSPKLFPACVLKVEEGMEVVTKSERLLHYRQTVLELLFAERNHVCSVCVEAVVRTFDPCLSCSTHAYGQMPLVVELLTPYGAKLDEVRRP